MKELENYTEEKRTIDLVKANIYGLLGVIPIVIIYVVPFYLFWKNKFTRINFKNEVSEFNIFQEGVSISFSIFLIIIVGIIVHEFIHGITWAIYAKNGFRSIKFGILLKMLTPYCHCKEPLKVNQYILGAIMPAIILGIIPAILAIISGSFLLLVFGIFFTMVAIGDFMIINLIRKEDSHSMVLDHPSEAGCYIYREK